MTKAQMGTLNIVFAVLLFVLCAGLLLFGDGSNTVPIALLPVAFANLTIGLVVRGKANG